MNGENPQPRNEGIGSLPPDLEAVMTNGQPTAASTVPEAQTRDALAPHDVAALRARLAEGTVADTGSRAEDAAAANEQAKSVLNSENSDATDNAESTGKGVEQEPSQSQDVGRVATGPEVKINWG